MARKVRKQINIDGAQETALKREATRLGVSESEIIRRAIDAWMKEDAEARRARAIAEHDEILDRIEARRAQAGPGKDYVFRREDAYEERMGRYDED